MASSSHSPTINKRKRRLDQSTNNQTHVSTTIAVHLLSKKYLNSNVVCSPLSLHVVLSILTAGSNGETLDELLGFLKTNTVDELNFLYSELVPLILADGRPNGGPQLAYANGVWVDKTLPLKARFKKVVDTVYKAACNQVDFRNKAVEVLNQVNLWAEKQTNGRIKKVLPADSVNNTTRLIFANAIYFKGVWSQNFDKYRTKEYDFHLLDGNKVQVPFMTNGKRQYVKEYNDFKVLGLPYLQGKDKREFTMYIFLPNAKYGLHSLVDKLGSTSDFIDCHIPRYKVEVRKFLMPKFKISFSFEASEMFKELELNLPFKSGDGFSDMVDSCVGQTLHVSAIYHKSFVEVNEEGTKAASASVAVMWVGCRMPMANDEVDFVADHPFLFVIREDLTGTVLFMGMVINPCVS